MSAEINDGGSAFPVHANHAVIDGRVVSIHETGMTLRDWFAGQAGEEDISAHQEPWQMRDGDAVPARSREEAKYRYADAMIAAREVKP